jgi:hypothetical protein
MGVIVAMVALGLTIVGLIVKLTAFNTEIRVWIEEMRKEMRVLKRIPMLEFRVSHIEKRLELSLPAMEEDCHDQ